MAEGYGYGKTILFGEHFVVYGLPAIASALGSKTEATVEDAGEYELVDERPGEHVYTASTGSGQYVALDCHGLGLPFRQ